MTRLHDLYENAGQSPWIDDLKRSYVDRGELADLIDLGIRGVTSNPTILSRSIESGDDYDEQFGDLIGSGTSVADAYWDLVTYDVTGALSILRPTFDQANGGDGFVSLEVDPTLAHDTEGTVTLANHLHDRIHQPNLLVKIPATREGLPAIEQTIAAGKSVNVTLIFSIERYRAVTEAYLTGLEAFAKAGGDLSSVASVASFFVSRVDTEVDRRLDDLASQGGARATEASALKGHAALAQARAAYGAYLEIFSSSRFLELQNNGARVQRPLWASTSTKNPSYPDLLYVDGLIGPNTVDTMPGETVSAFVDHGIVQRTIDTDLPGAQQTLARLAEVGIDMDAVTEQLELEGVAAFSKSFQELNERLEQKATALGARR